MQVPKYKIFFRTSYLMVLVLNDYTPTVLRLVIFCVKFGYIIYIGLPLTGSLIKKAQKPTNES